MEIFVWVNVLEVQEILLLFCLTIIIIFTNKDIFLL